MEVDYENEKGILLEELKYNFLVLEVTQSTFYDMFWRLCLVTLVIVILVLSIMVYNYMVFWYSGLLVFGLFWNIDYRI